ncbi:MAG: VanZ family protein [Methylococcaceae bacterium]|nr:VanZ family protein [Methylococcaceae bacterium]
MRDFLRGGIVLSYVLLLVFLSLNPWLRPDAHQAVGFITWDLVDHAAAYGLLTVLLLSQIKWRGRQSMITLLAVMVSAALGVFLEFGQLWLTSVRSFSWFDAYANIFGAVMGAFAFWLIRLSASLRKLGILRY